MGDDASSSSLGPSTGVSALGDSGTGANVRWARSWRNSSMRARIVAKSSAAGCGCARGAAPPYVPGSPENQSAARGRVTFPPLSIECKPSAVGNAGRCRSRRGHSRKSKIMPGFLDQSLHQKSLNLVSGMGLMGWLELKIVAATRQRPLMCRHAARRPTISRSAVRAYTRRT